MHDFFTIQQMVGILTARFYNDNLDRAVERTFFRRHLRRDRGPPLDTDIGSLVGRKYRWDGPVNATLPDGFAIDKERHVSTFGETSPVVGELHPYLMLAWRKRSRGGYDELLKPKKVVNVCKRPVFHIEHPSATDPALRQNRSLGRRSFGYDDLCCNRM